MLRGLVIAKVFFSSLLLIDWIINLRLDFFRSLLEHHPIFHASTTPAYSNTAFQLLAYALETITNKPYSQMLSDDIFKPLNMTHSSYSQPANTTFAVIPFNESASDWSFDLGTDSPYVRLYMPSA